MGIQLNVTEWMEGYIGFGATSYAAGEQQGRETNKTFAHQVEIEMSDIDVFVTEPTHTARLDGTVTWLGAACPFTGGEFNMLVKSTDPRVRFMFYRIPFVDGAGAAFTMLGFKQLEDDRGPDAWRDITTLFIRIYDGNAAGHDFTKPTGDTPVWPAGEIALGIIRISPSDSFHSALSFAAPGAGRLAKLGAIEKFVAFYGNGLFDLYVRESRAKRRWLLLAGLAVVAGVLVLLLR